MEAGGRLKVNVGDVSISAMIGSGGVEAVASGGMDYGASVAGTQAVQTGCAVYNTNVEAGDVQNVRGIAQSTLVRSGGRTNALAGGTAFGTDVEAGDLLAVYSGGRAADVSVAGRARLAAGAVLDGANAFSGATVSGETSSTRIVLASGASLSACGSTDMARLHLDARNEVLAFAGAGHRLGSVQLDGKASIAFGVSGMAPRQKAVLALETRNAQEAGSFSLSAATMQALGRYLLASGIALNQSAPWTVSAGGNAVHAHLDGTTVSAGGTNWRLLASDGAVIMTAEVRAGWMKHGNARANELKGSADGDVFWVGS